jgi:hypothetical protein
MSTYAAQVPEDIINIALTGIGQARITNIFEGSRNSRAALNIYAQTRDALLRDGNWPFAERNVNGTLLKGPPSGQPGIGYIPPATWNPATNPPIPWLYEYAYPSDCLKERAVKPAPMFIPNFAPSPNIFAVLNDNGLNPPQRVICCNVPNAVIVYTGQITDPNTMPPDFIEAFVDALAEGFTAALATPEFIKIKAAQGQLDEAKASVEQG